jgi:membrane protease subunit (stomatin/prohibitin family)
VASSSAYFFDLEETSIKAGGKQLSLFFDPEYGGDMFLRNVG